MTKSGGSWTVAGVVLAAAAIGAACGQPTGGGNAAQARAVQQKAHPVERRQDACALIDRGDIEQIAGVKLGMLLDIVDSDQTTCELRKEGTTTPVIMSVSVYWRGGKEKARIEQAGRSMARQLLNDGEVNIEELTGSQKVKGLADKAYFNDVLPSWVLKDDVFIEFITPTLGHEETLKAFTVSAKKAIARLPDQLPRR